MYICTSNYKSEWLIQIKLSTRVMHKVWFLSKENITFIKLKHNVILFKHTNTNACIINDFFWEIVTVVIHWIVISKIYQYYNTRIIDSNFWPLNTDKLEDHFLLFDTFWLSMVLEVYQFVVFFFSIQLR